MDPTDPDPDPQHGLLGRTGYGIFHLVVDETEKRRDDDGDAAADRSG